MSAARPTAFGEALVRLHDELRRELREIRADLGRSADAPPGRDLRTHCLAFCTHVETHHRGEDAVLFPHLAREHPELAEVLARLGREHQVVARGLDELRAALEPGREPRAVRAEVERIAAALEAHLDHEEEQLVAVLDALTTLPDGI